jgi:hypothetical protein
MEFLTKNICGWQNGQILGYVNACGSELQQFDLLRVLTGAEDDTEG